MTVQHFTTLNKLVWYTGVFSVIKTAFVGRSLARRHKHGCVADYKQALFLKLGRGEVTGELSQSLPPRWRSLDLYLLY